MIKAFVLSLVLAAIFSIAESRQKPRRMPRPQLNNIHADQCEVVQSTDCPKRYLPPGKRICLQITEENLRKRLKGVGAYNPLYTAMNRKEAENFTDPRYFYRSKPPINKLPARKKCNKTRLNRPQRRESNIERSLDEEEDGVNLLSQNHDQGSLTSKETLQEDSASGSNITISESTGSKTQSCWNRSDVVADSANQRFHLCGECHVVTTLPDDVIPRIINEASCKHGLPDNDPNKETDGNGCAYSSGLCEQRVVHFPALKMSGYEIDKELSAAFGAFIYVEKWVEFTQQIKAGCQCQMFQVHKEYLKRQANKS